MPSVRCPGCDEVVEIEPDWYGRKVACPSCDMRFVARRPGAPDEDEPDDRPKRRRAWDDDEDDDRPKKKAKRRERPQPMGRGAKQLLAVGVIGGGLLLCCLGCVGWGAFQVMAPVSYPEPWVSQSLPDGAYSVRFPRRPVAEGGNDPLGGGTNDARYTLEADGVKDAVFVFGQLDGTDLTLDAVLQEVIKEVKKETGAKASSPRPITSAGLSGKEVEFTVGGGKLIYRLLDASRGGRRRFVRVMAGGRSVSDADRTKFLDSLTTGK